MFYEMWPSILEQPANPEIKIISSAVGDAPDGLGAVFANKQAAVFGDSDSNGTTPDFAVRRNEAGDEIFIFAACPARGLVEWHADDFVTSPFHSVP